MRKYIKESSDSMYSVFILQFFQLMLQMSEKVLQSWKNTLLLPLILINYRISLDSLLNREIIFQNLYISNNSFNLSFNKNFSISYLFLILLLLFYKKMKLQEESDTKAHNIFPQQNLTVIAITWNLFASLPPYKSLTQLYQSSFFSIAPDVVFLGTQQCERSLLASVCFESKTRWEEMIESVFSQFLILTSMTMGGLHSCILIKKKLRDYCSVENRIKLRAGYCGLMGNKGAISIEIFILGQYFQFINCHLAPHQTQTEKRNQTIQRVLERIVQPDENCQIIFLGDFNYRIDITKKQYQMIVKSSKKNTEEEVGYSSYFNKQQLINQFSLKNFFLTQFQEGNVSFPPTYKLDINSNQYNVSRIPGWTDRIFHRMRQGPNKMILEGYTCQYNIMGCDHRPVIARYTKSLIPNQVYCKDRRIHADRQSSCQMI